jgi:hypothetical protein
MEGYDAIFPCAPIRRRECTKRGSRIQKPTEQSENVYENKGLDEKSLAGADVAPKRPRCGEGAVRSNSAEWPDLSLRDIADPKHAGSAPAPMVWLRAES